MIAHVKYFGFYPLGDEIELNGIKIMQKEWMHYDKRILLIGKKNKVSPIFCDVFYVENEGEYTFFAAYEYGLGHYIIYFFNSKTNIKLNKKMNQRDYELPVALIVYKNARTIKVYGRYLGQRDEIGLISDSFFKYKETIRYDEYIRYVFTNSGIDRIYVDVFEPKYVEETDAYILIGKAKKIICDYQNDNKTLFVYEPLSYGIKLTTIISDNTSEVIFK